MRTFESPEGIKLKCDAFAYTNRIFPVVKFTQLVPQTTNQSASCCKENYKRLFLKINFIYLFIYLFLAALGLRCCARAFSSCGERGLLFVVVCGLLIAVASLVAEHRL